MQLLADTDLMVFLGTVGKILLTGPFHIGRNVRPIPVRFEIEELSPGSLSIEQQQYLEKFDKRFAAMNYMPVATYRATNYVQNLVRSYVNPLEPVRAIVMIVELTVRVGRQTSSVHKCVLEFFTHLADGRLLTTRNMQLKSLLDEPPYRIIQECPRVTDPGELRRRHLARLAKIDSAPLAPAADFASICREFQFGHERQTSYQLQSGTYRLDPSGSSYVLTNKVRWRGIRNFLNPFVQRFSPWRFLPAAFTGIALPVFAWVLAAPLTAQHTSMMGLPGGVASPMTMLAAYGLAGATIGYLLQRNSFLWSFVLTYLAVGAVIGFHENPLPYSTIAGVVAHYFGQIGKSSRLILQPKVALGERSQRTSPPSLTR